MKNTEYCPNFKCIHEVEGVCDCDGDVCEYLSNTSQAIMQIVWIGWHCKTGTICDECRKRYTYECLDEPEILNSTNLRDYIRRINND